MRKTILITGFAILLLSGSLNAQLNLNWSSSFSPAWSNGALSRTASNIGGSNINCTATVSITGPGAFVQALGSSGSQTPTVTGATFTIPGTGNRLQITTNYNQNTSYTTVVLSFSSTATNVFFRIVDIDKSASASTTYFDRVTVTGNNGASTINPSLSKYSNTDPNFLVVSGNVAHVNTTSGQAGNTASDAGDQRGTIDVNFGTAVLNSVTIRYDNAAGADNNPDAQAIAIGAVSFSQVTLPVSLTDFSAHRQNQDVVLNWITTQEYNSASFEIERSNGSNSWQKIGELTAAGFSNAALNYSFRDINPAGAILLYRLKQLDIDGHFKYSGIVRIAAKGSGPALTVYPNPFHDQVNISFRSASQQTITIGLSDIKGSTIKTLTRNIFPGDNNIPVTGLSDLPAGIYYVSVYDATGNIIGRSKILRD